MKIRHVFAFGLLVVCLVGIAVTAYSQQGRRRPMRGGGNSAVDEPFRGVTAGGEIQPGVFKIESTGVSTKPVVEAADAFLASLTDQQREKTVFPVDDAEWRQWDNRHFPKRQGVGFDEMDDRQRDHAFGLLQASLSAKGLKLSKDIMKLNGTLAELADNYDEYGRWLYWITIMGKPSETEPWGWQIDGHHLIINYFVLGDQVVMSPVFVGSEPVHAVSGEFAGTVVLQEQQDKALQLIQALDADQQSKAILSRAKPGNNALAQAYRDNVNIDYAGIEASKLDQKQRDLLIEVVQSFVGNMRDGHAEIKMDEVRSHLDQTYFAWIGDTKADSVFYYRIQSPVVLIEFDHQRRVAPFRSDRPTRDHIHAVLRTPNGNDYGKDLLRQHYHSHHHGE
ncbi:DUF3500 domain-containing protein [Crateriforma conspicua]|nr:DUF3500 domain-containing protein [Crateriforma conspicua]